MSEDKQVTDLSIASLFQVSGKYALVTGNVVMRRSNTCNSLVSVRLCQLMSPRLMTARIWWTL